MPRSPSIRGRIRRAILLACAVVLIATVSAFVAYDIRSFKNELVDHLSTVAAVVADNVRVPVAFESPEDAVDILAALKAEQGLEAAAVFDSERRLFATYPTNVASNLLPSQLGAGSHLQRKSVTLFAPIEQDGKRIGTLYLRASLDRLYERLWQYAKIVIGLIIVATLGAILLSRKLERRISEPILELSGAATQVAQSEDYSIRAKKITDDELGTLTDSFNRMLAETQEHHKRLTEQARLLDLSNDAIIVRDRQGRIVYWNRGASEIYGWTKAEAVGKTKEELLKTEFLVPLDQILHTLEREGRWQGELIQSRRDGSRIHVITRWALDKDADGRPGNTLISDNDITERKKAEEALRENEERFRALGNNIPQLAWMTDPTGHIFWYNQRWYDYTGTTLEEMKGWGWAKVHHPDHIERVRVKWSQHLNLGQEWEDTFPLRGKDGEYRWFLSRAFPIKDSKGEILRWFGTNTDITEQKVSEEQLERMVRERTARLEETIGELEAFSYSISHDMRSPLRAMQGYARILLADYQNKMLDAKAQHYLDRIQKGSNRLDMLIQDVLAYSKVAQGDIDLHPVDLGKLIDEIVPAHPEFQPPLANVNIEKPLPAVVGHEAYLTQCLTNLIGNSVRFAKEGQVPEVRIRAEDAGANVRIWIEDQGIGIDPAHFQRIFEIFGQVHGEKKYGGTGIGLAIVRKAVLRMNGEIGVDSEVGKGSRFWILLKKAA